MNASLPDAILKAMQSHRGRDRAIPRADLLFQLQARFMELQDRQLRECYAELPVCSSASAPHGLWLPESRQEIDSFMAEYRCHVAPEVVARRLAIFKRAYHEFYPEDDRQRGLFT